MPPKSLLRTPGAGQYVNLGRKLFERSYSTQKMTLEGLQGISDNFDLANQFGELAQAGINSRTLRKAMCAVYLNAFGIASLPHYFHTSAYGFLRMMISLGYNADHIKGAVHWISCLRKTIFPLLDSMIRVEYPEHLGIHLIHFRDVYPEVYWIPGIVFQMQPNLFDLILKAYMVRFYGEIDKENLVSSFKSQGILQPPQLFLCPSKTSKDIPSWSGLPDLVSHLQKKFEKKKLAVHVKTGDIWEILPFWLYLLYAFEEPGYPNWSNIKTSCSSPGVGNMPLELGFDWNDHQISISPYHESTGGNLGTIPLLQIAMG